MLMLEQWPGERIFLYDGDRLLGYLWLERIFGTGRNARIKVGIELPREIRVLREPIAPESDRQKPWDGFGGSTYPGKGAV